jgi:soluble lytic murein transglycosylase-like protein
MDVQSTITAAAAKYGVDPSLALAVAQQESGFNPSAVSSAGAVGVMQLMPATAAQFGADPYDPAQNIDAGVHYLSNLLHQFGGDVSLALAAYNSGPGTVQKYGGIPPYPETQSYVSKILAALGLDLSPPNPSTGPRRTARAGAPTKARTSRRQA